MKLKLSLVLSFTVIIIFAGCSKNDDGKCIKCEQNDSVEVCDAGDGKVSLVVEGKTVDTQALGEGQTLEEIAEQTCSSITVENCYECMGPNVNDFDICEEGDNITINGEIIPDSNGADLDDLVKELIDNATDEVVFRNLTCNKK